MEHTAETHVKHGIHLRLWHGWHKLHQIIAGYGLVEFVQHVYDNHEELIVTIQHLMELIK